MVASRSRHNASSRSPKTYVPITPHEAGEGTNLTNAPQACQSALGNAEYYDHAKVEQWNATIIVRLPAPSLSASNPNVTRI
jgi:hypothetical protein